MSEADNFEPELLQRGAEPDADDIPHERDGDSVEVGTEPWDHPAIQAEHKLLGQMAGKTEFAGLALSGGGIRSATFGLGVLQAFKEKHLLERFDYLSSVSGGGYIAAWLSANCRRQGRRWLSAATRWDDSIRHLRRFSNYLSPQVGFFSADTWSMLMIWVRNALLMQLSMLLALAALLLLPRILEYGFPYVPVSPWARGLTVGLFIAAIVSVCANLVSLHCGLQIKAGAADPPTWSFTADGWRAWLPVCAAFAAIDWFLCRVSDFAPFSNGPVSPMAFPIALFMVAAAFCAVPPLLALKRQLSGSLPGEDSVVNYGQRKVQVTVILPIIVTAYTLSAVLWGLQDPATSPDPMYGDGSYSVVLAEGWLYWPFPLAVAFAAFVLLAFCSMRGIKLKVERDFKRLFKRSVMAFLASTLCILVLHAQFSGIVLLMQHLHRDAASGTWQAFALGAPLLLLAFSLSITLLIGLIGQSSIEGIREWWSRAAAWLCIYSFGWGIVVSAAVYGPLAIAWIAAKDITDQDNWAKVTAAATWLVATLGGLLAAKSGRSKGDDKIRSAETSTTDKAINMLAVFGPYVFVVGLVLGVATLLHLVLWGMSTNELSSAWLTAAKLERRHWNLMDPPLGFTLATFAFCLVAWLFLSYRVDINVFSLNAFYRNRLVRCYLGATRQGQREPQNFTNFDEADDMPVSDLARNVDCGPPGRPDGPLHIINCALNLGGSSDLDLHTRHSASFTVTPYLIGSAYLKNHAPEDPFPGYQPHVRYGSRGKHVSLGQAISVSGAAASPNMGYHSSPATAMLLTLFNVRLGWWFRSPVRPDATDSSPRFGPLYLLSELFAVAHDRLKYLMVSDGGHFENLAVYELIKRRCKLIVVSDAECDPDMKFEGLGTLIRMCKIDFNVDIEIDVGKLALAPGASFSAARFATGIIRYNDRWGTVGRLLYIKASMDGVSEGTSVRQYRESHPGFPHESTGDQFYGEDQFESYRALGFDIARSLLEKGLSRYEWMEMESAMPGILVQQAKEKAANKLYRHYRPDREPLALRPLANKNWRNKQRAVRH
jgi:hypothetical protein